MAYRAEWKGSGGKDVAPALENVARKVIRYHMQVYINRISSGEILMKQVQFYMS